MSTVPASRRALRWTDVLFLQRRAARSLAVTRRHPRALLVLCLIEAAERCAASLLGALSIFYLTEQVHLPPSRALELNGTFNALAYLATVGGGFIADRLLGYGRTMALGMVALAAGYAMLANEGAWLFQAGAVLIIGHGLFKSTVSASVGRLYAPGDPRRGSAYSWFYFAVNCGGALGPIVGSVLQLVGGWRAAVLAAVVSLLLGLFLWLAGYRHLALLEAKPVGQAARSSLPPLSCGERLHQLGLLLVGLVLFGLVHFQIGGTLLLYARDATERTIGKFALPASLFAALPAVLTLLLTPLLAAWRNRSATSRRKLETRWLLVAGSLATGGGFAVLTVADVLREGGLLNPLWLIGALTLLTVGEVLLLPASLEQVSALANERYAAFSLAFWCLALALGQWGAGRLGGWWSAWPHHQFFMVMVLIAFGAGLIFVTMNHDDVRPNFV
jgi:POT family proton-dependent oligopeptide transporter